MSTQAVGTGCTQEQAGKVIARLSAPGRSQVQLVGEMATATWGGVEVEWHYRPTEEQPGHAGDGAPAPGRRGTGGPWMSR